MSRALLVADVETNGLDVDVHHVWEMAYWNLATGARAVFLPFIGNGRDFMAAASRQALRVNRFIDRWTDERLEAEDYSMATARSHLAGFLENVWPKRDDPESRAVMVCAQPKFDLPFISKTLAAHDVTASWAKEPTDQVEPWFYRAIDLSSYAAGVLGLNPRNPESASSVAARLAVYCEPGTRHTAEGDVTMTGRAALLLDWIGNRTPRFTLDDLDRILEDAPSGDEIDTLIG